MIAMMLLAPSGSAAASAVTSVQGGSFRGLTFGPETRCERYGTLVGLWCDESLREPIEAMVSANAGWRHLCSDRAATLVDLATEHPWLALGYLLGKAGA